MRDRVVSVSLTIFYQRVESCLACPLSASNRLTPNKFFHSLEVEHFSRPTEFTEYGEDIECRTVEWSVVGCLYLYVFVLWLAGVRTVQCSELCTAVRSTALL